MLNKAIIMGRLVRDPEVKIFSGGTALTLITVAVDRDYQKPGEDKKTDFIKCRAWRQTGEFINNYFTKGSMIVIEGSLQIDTWEDEKSDRHEATYIRIDKARFGEKKRDSAGEKPYATRTRDSYRPPDISAADFEEMPDDGELPF